MQNTVFISYSQKDMDFVKQLKAQLEAEHIGVTIDIEAAKIGDHLQDFIETAVRENEFTISVISKNSLQSVWVIAESLENFMYEKVEKRKRFLPIFIDRSVFDDDFFLEVAGIVKGKIDELVEKSQRARELGVGTEHYDTKRKRLEDLKNNLSKIFDMLRERLSADFTSEEKITGNFPKLVGVIKESIERVDSGQSSANVSAQSPTTHLTPGERERLEKEWQSLKEHHELYSMKIDRLEKALVIETDAARIFQIEQQLKEPKAKRDELAEQIQKIEMKLGE